MPLDVLKPPKNVGYLQKCEHKHPTSLRANPSIIENVHSSSDAWQFDMDQLGLSTLYIHDMLVVIKF